MLDVSIKNKQYFCDNPRCFFHVIPENHSILTDSMTISYNEKDVEVRRHMLYYRANRADENRTPITVTLFFCDICKTAIELGQEKMDEAIHNGEG